jgi:hypothetical protein
MWNNHLKLPKNKVVNCVVIRYATYHLQWNGFCISLPFNQFELVEPYFHHLHVLLSIVKKFGTNYIWGVKIDTSTLRWECQLSWINIYHLQDKDKCKPHQKALNLNLDPLIQKYLNMWNKWFITQIHQTFFNNHASNLSFI